MPFEWVEPELAVEYKGKKIYYLYRCDLVEQGKLKYWFTTDIHGSDGDEFAFDIREFDYPKELVVEYQKLEWLIDNDKLTFPNYFVN